MATVAEQLAGLTLDRGWRVVKLLPRTPGGTGGNFSRGYIVESAQGKQAFLKALDFSRALAAPDPAIALQGLTEAFNFERAVLVKCRERRLDRVVVALDDGTVRVNGEPVQYLIFELADGDARSQATAARRFELAWILRALHHVTTGLAQLHREDIVHQDLKPSNVLSFAGGAQTKLSDLGRAAYKGHTPPHDALPFAGDPAYAPVESLYGHVDPDWNRRRLGCDAYLLGSMVAFFFTGVGTTALLRAELLPAHAWGAWAGSFPQALPYVRDAFARVTDRVAQSVDARVREDIVAVIQELCEPDPSLRGHPSNRIGHANQYGLERYVALFDLLARRVELGLL